MIGASIPKCRDGRSTGCSGLTADFNHLTRLRAGEMKPGSRGLLARSRWPFEMWPLLYAVL